MIVIAALVSGVAVVNVATESRVVAVGVEVQREKARAREIVEDIRRVECEVSRLKAPRALRDRALAFEIDIDSPGRREAAATGMNGTFVAGGL